MPSDSDSDSEQEGSKPARDEYGDIFEDYGFLKRAEEFKAQGNAEFKKDRFEKAMSEYNSALDQLITVEHDKSIVVGKRKWHDVVIMRSTIHLNVSTCYYKLGEWQKSLEAAVHCLHGSNHEQMMFSDPQIRQKIKTAAKQGGTLQVGEQRLPKATRAKAYFRICLCCTNLNYLDRAKDALASARDNCDDDTFLTELARHASKLEALLKEQKEHQMKQFAGFFDKLKDTGGYMREDMEAASRADKQRCTKIKDQLSHLEALDNSDDSD